MSVFRAWSLGAGVQSSTGVLMSAYGEIDRVDCAIFADTQAEPPSVYRWLDWLEQAIAAAPYPFPVHRVTAGSLTERVTTMRVSAAGKKYSNTSVPFFTVNADASHGKINHRSCTAEFKIRPIIKTVRRLAGIKRGEKEIRVEQFIGISLDEAHRMKPAREPWIENRWPLIEVGMRRNDCLRWMESHGFPPPPRSSCYFCPYHNNREWRRLLDEEPEYFARAVEFERTLQAGKKNSDNFDSVPYLHADRVPLDQVDLSTAADAGQVDLFGNECEGMCGV